MSESEALSSAILDEMDVLEAFAPDTPPQVGIWRCTLQDCCNMKCWGHSRAHSHAVKPHMWWSAVRRRCHLQLAASRLPPAGSSAHHLATRVHLLSLKGGPTASLATEASSDNFAHAGADNFGNADASAPSHSAMQSNSAGNLGPQVCHSCLSVVTPCRYCYSAVIFRL